tara:strand:+ start:6203 stop:7714 length:1512 start_codon:yes stop_codon:yes gene_type:complete
MTIKFLQSRNGFLRYRRKVPAHLRAYLGDRSEIVQSLGLSAGQEALAVQRIHVLDREVSRLLMEAEKVHRAAADPHAMAVAAEAWALANKFIGSDQSGRAAGPNEESEFDHWLEQILRSYSNTEPELEDLDAMTRVQIETVRFGGRVPVALSIGRAVEAYATHQQGGDLKKAEATALAQLYEWINADATLKRKAKGTPETLPMREVSRAIARNFIAHLHEGLKQKASTITRRVNSLKAVWTFASDHFDDAALGNPWSRQKPPVASKSDYVAADERMPFNHQHLALVEAQLRSNSIDPYVRSIIKLLRVTGCRPMEIAGLTRADVFLDEPTPWVWIRNNGVRRLKTNTSQRRIPVLPEVVTDLRALSAAADGHDAPLFPSYLTSTTSLSYRLSVALKAAGIPKSRRLVPYSFRHTIAEALKVSGVPEFHTKAILGHADQTMTGIYGAGGVDVADLMESLKRAVGRLGDVPDYVYRPDELCPVPPTEGAGLECRTIDSGESLAGV